MEIIQIEKIFPHKSCILLSIALLLFTHNVPLPFLIYIFFFILPPFNKKI